MANPKIEYSKEEIDEILELYREKLKKEGKLLTEFKCKSVSNFNKELVDNNIKRKDGSPFTLYKYHFWAGRQGKDGDYNYGKKAIMEKNYELSETLHGKERDVDIQDILTIIERNYKNPTKMTNLICSYIRKEQKQKEKILEENMKLTEENQKLRNQNIKMQDSFTNIFFNSQFPGNSLNDMMTCEKSGDAFIQSELNNMFEDGLARIEALANIANNYSTNKDNNPSKNKELQNLIQLDKKRRENERMEDFNNEGF